LKTIEMFFMASPGAFDLGVNTISGSILALADADRGGSDYAGYCR
jgi:hypothetical protein